MRPLDASRLVDETRIFRSRWETETRVTYAKFYDA